MQKQSLKIVILTVLWLFSPVMHETNHTTTTKKPHTVDTKLAIEGPSFSQSENPQWNIFSSLLTLKRINDETKLK